MEVCGEVLIFRPESQDHAVGDSVWLGFVVEPVPAVELLAIEGSLLATCPVARKTWFLTVLSVIGSFIL